MELETNSRTKKKNLTENGIFFFFFFPECNISAGDLLYIPFGWMRQFTSVTADDSAAIAFNWNFIPHGTVQQFLTAFRITAFG